MDLAVVASLRDIKLQISELNTQVKALEVTKRELETS